MSPLPLSALESYLMHSQAGPVHAATGIMSSYVSGLCSRALFPRCSYNLCASPSMEFSEPWREGFDGYNSFSTECSKIIVCTLFSCESVFVSRSFRRKSWWLSMALIYGYSKMLLGVILSLHSSSWSVVFGFMLCHWPLWSRVLQDGFHLMWWALLNSSIYCLIIPTSFVTLLH